MKPQQITAAEPCRGISFSAPMILKILEGRKTQTRRVIKRQPDRIVNAAPWWDKVAPNCPYVGWPSGLGKLWVREWFYIDHVDFRTGRLPAERPDDLDEMIYYRADGECCEQIPECSCAEVGKPKWRSPLFMPQWASRITLNVNGTRTQRLQQISEQDANAEGFAGLRNCPATAAVHSFRDLWDKLNGGKAGCAWKDNPWVWVVSFEVVKGKGARA